MNKIIVIVIGAILTNILTAKSASVNECWRIELQLNEANYDKVEMQAT